MIMDDTAAAALGITAILATVQETLPTTFASDPRVYRAMRAGMALSVPLFISRERPWQRAVVTGLGIWGAAELLQLGYSTLMMSADTLFYNIKRRRPGRVT